MSTAGAAPIAKPADVKIMSRAKPPRIRTGKERCFGGGGGGGGVLGFGTDWANGEAPVPLLVSAGHSMLSYAYRKVYSASDELVLTGKHATWSRYVVGICV